ncbi:MAG: DEAD/DEAH box helicase family protein [Prolixibacteraceae bacterium]|nr:DEAD/DEAH box helicase family protein [Prolixibacteraceae bacterium]
MPLNIDQIQVAIKNEFGNKSIEELIITEKELASKKNTFLSNHKTKSTYKKLINHIEDIQSQPRFPYTNGPRQYQIDAYNKWIENGYKGIFEMATGTGKTITSLNCLLELHKQTKSYKAIIAVPTTALLEQWKRECSKFNFKNVITVSSKEKWNDKLSFFNAASRLTDISFIVIVTYASLIRAKFLSHFKLLPQETLLIADEVHNLGAASLLKLLPGIHLQKRIGLSATPSRKYDLEGNSAIDSFFNDTRPYIFSYSMKQALALGWLCKYKYFPHIVYLTDEELSEYIKISKQLLKYFDSKTGRYKECQEVDILLLQRKRIIHKAVNKKTIFRQIVHNEFRNKGNLKYSLIYVPEGLEPDYSKIDEYEEDEEEFRLINEYTRIVKDIDESIMVKQYTSQTQGKDDIINDFEKGIVHVLTSMKCLDEGVDVPRSELAVFCSSTGNPRQFIQRRGRVLRLHKDKIFAVIHDLVVVPRIFSDQGNYEMERNLLKKELERVVDFSELSMNKIDTYEALNETIDSYNLNLNDLIFE